MTEPRKKKQTPAGRARRIARDIIPGRGEASALLRLSQALLGATEAQAVMNQAIATVVEVFHPDLCKILLLDETGESLRLSAGRGWRKGLVGRATVPTGADSQAGYTLMRRRPVRVDDFSRETRFRPPPLLVDHGVAAGMSAPMLAGHRAIGVLGAHWRRRHPCSKAEARLLALIANMTAQALERARLWEDNLERLRTLQGLHEMSQAFAAMGDLRETIRVITERAARLVGAEACLVTFFDPVKQEVRAVAPGFGVSDAQVAEFSYETDAEAVALWDTARDETFIENDPARLPPRFRTLAERLGIRNVLAARMVAHERPVGMLYTGNKASGGSFTSDDARLLATLANQGAIAIVNARLYVSEREERELAEALRDTGTALGAALDFDLVLDRLLEQIERVVPYDSAYVMLVDGRTGRVGVARQRGYERFSAQAARDTAALKFDLATTANWRRMAETQRPLVTPDTAADPGWIRIEGWAHVRSWAGAPIVVQGQVIGFLSLDKIEPNFYHSGHAERLAAFAGQAALAMQNARLFEAVQRRVAQQSALAAIISSATQAGGDLRGLFEAALDHMLRALGLPMGAVWLIPSANAEHQFVVRGLPPEIGAASARVAAAEHQELLGPVVVPDWQAAERPGAGELTSLGVRASITVPLLSDKKRIGGLSVAAPEPREWIAEEIALVEAVGRELGGAAERARLFETTRRQLDELAILHVVATAAVEATSEDALIERATQVIGLKFFPDDFGVLLLDEAAGVLRLHPSYRGVRAADKGLTIPLGKGITGWVASRGQSRRVADITCEPEYLDVVSGVRSELAVPLKVGDRVIGVINAESGHVNAFSEADERLLATLAGQLATAIEKVRLYAQGRQRLDELEFLHRTTLVVTTSPDLDAALEQVVALLADERHYAHVAIALLDEGGETIHVRAQRGIPVEQWGPAGQGLHIGQGLVGWVVQHGEPLLVGDVSQDPRYVAGISETKSELVVPLRVGDRTIGVVNVESPQVNALSAEDLRLLATLAGQLAASIERAALFDKIRRRVDELQTLAVVSSSLRQAQTRDAMLPLLVESAMQALHADAGTLILIEGDDLVFAAVRGPGEALLGRRHPPGEDPLWHVVRTGEALFIPDVTEHAEFNEWEICRALMPGLRACACVPLQSAEATIGILHLACRAKRAPGEDEIRLLSSIAEMAGNALQRAALHEQTERRLQRLTVLRAIDTAISASLDLRVTLNVLLDQAATQLRLDAADVLLLNPHTQMLDYAAGRGFRTDSLQHTHLRLGEGYAGRAALERQVVSVPDLRGRETDLLRSPHFAAEGFVAYYASPLTAKGQVKGVLEIFHRSPLEFDREWQDFLEGLATQAAIAMDNASLFDNLQRSSVELTLAYDATIEGWSKALELRDQETEGHTQRVTEMALRLARAMGMNEEELVHVRRGALLHDIGKMGIPDSILFKPGALSEKEWAVMHDHPLFAYELLSPIAYLRPALDIPHYHHEKWDGTGYPRGLKGEQIPLAARIFAVADVWDALRSDRPYRRAWPEEQVRDYLRQEAGKHFDPEVVDAFLSLEG